MKFLTSLIESLAKLTVNEEPKRRVCVIKDYGKKATLGELEEHLTLARWYSLVGVDFSA